MTNQASLATLTNSIADNLFMLQRFIPNAYNSRLGYRFSHDGTGSLAWLIPFTIIGAFSTEKLVPLSEAHKEYELNILFDTETFCLVNYPPVVSTATSTFSLQKIRLHLAVRICTNYK